MSMTLEEKVAQALQRAHAAGVRQVGAGRTVEGLEFRVTTSASGDGHHMVVIGNRGDFEQLVCDCLGSAGCCMHKALVWQSLTVMSPAPRLSKRLEVKGARRFEGVLASR